MRATAERARTLVKAAARLLVGADPISAAGCMRHSIVTAPEMVSVDARRRLELLIGRYLEVDSG